jgi:hypothetical protein
MAAAWSPRGADAAEDPDARHREIAREFQLPERRAKLAAGATVERKADGESNAAALFCICKQPYTDTDVMMCVRWKPQPCRCDTRLCRCAESEDCVAVAAAIAARNGTTRPASTSNPRSDLQPRKRGCVASTRMDNPPSTAPAPQRTQMVDLYDSFYCTFCEGRKRWAPGRLPLGG